MTRLRIIVRSETSVPHPTRNLFFFLVSLWLTVAGIAADFKAPDKYTLREWTESSGLPDNEVASVQLDEKGFLWVVTSSGPVRFDGTSFEPVKMPSAASPRSTIYYRGKSADGCTGLLAPVNIPAGTDSATVAEANGFYGQGPDGEFQFIHEPSLSGKTVRALFADTEDSLWLACDDGTLLRRHGRQTQVFPPPDASGGKKIPVFATDKDQQLWISIGSTIARFDGTQWVPQPVEPADPQIRICSSRTGGPWLFTRTAVFKQDSQGWQEIIKLPELLGAHYIQTAMEDRHGNLWIGTRSQGLFRLTDKQLLHVPTSSEDIVSLCEDGDDNIWVATHGGGLNRLRPKAHQLYDQSSGLKDVFSYTVTEDASGVIWLANRDGGIARIINGAVDPISRRANWRPFSAMSVAPAAGGGIWITTGIGGYRATAEDPEQVQRIAALANFKGVRSTLVARNGDYWFSVDPDRIARLREDQVTLFGPADGFDGREIRAITEDSNGTIWLGAAEGRIYRSTSDGRFERVPFLGMENAGAVQVLRFESDDTLLAGTTRHGLFIFPPGDRATPKVLNSKNGLPNNNVTQILIDEFDRYWFASRAGIFWIHRPQVQAFYEGKSSRVHAVTLGSDDGMPGLVCLGLFQPAAWKGRDGKLWFATRRGVLRTDPALISGIDDLPPVTVSEVKCDGLTRPASERMEIQSTTRKTEIRLSVLCLSSPERVLVRYRLDGFDNDWVVQKGSRTATYPRLPPGKYTFRAMASNGNDVWNEQAELLTISVNPPWWQSIWAQMMYLTALVIVVAGTVRIWSHRRLQLRLQKLEQEQAIERERTRIARNIHDELGASLTHISLITQAAQHENPTQASTFEKIYEATHEITRSMDEVVWAVNPQCDDLENLVYYVSNFAQRLLSAANIRCRLDLPQTLPALRLSSPVRHNLFLCCKEALNNAVKHSQADLVTIAIKMDGSALQLIVADNGRGLNQPTARATTDALRIATGNGLDNLRNRMAEVGGACEVSNRPEGGLIVTFSIDLSASTT